MALISKVQVGNTQLGDSWVRKNRSFDGLPTGTVVSTFLTPSDSPKFCDKRNDENGEGAGVGPVATAVVV